MNVSSVVSPATELVGTVQGQAQIAMMKKATDLEAQQAMQLIASVPQPPTAMPGQPGGVIDTYA